MKPGPDEVAGDPAVSTARTLLGDARFASLATLSPEGLPFVTLVAVAGAEDLAPLLLLSRLAVHTQNLVRDPRASLLVVRHGGDRDPLADARLTLTGEVAALGKDPAARSVFLEKHPEAAGYADFADFAFYRFEIAGGHLVAGFGRISDLNRSELLSPPSRKG